MSNQPHPFTAADLESPTYCIGCQTHIPKTLADQGQGLCPACLAKINGPAAAPPASAPPVATPPPPPRQSYAPPAPAVRPKKKIPTWGWVLIGLFVIGGIGNLVDPKKTESASEPISTAAPTPAVKPKPKTPAEIAREKKEAALAAAQAKREVAAQAKEAADLARRGPKPVPSEWDGITPEVNAYLKENLKDYESLKVVDCSPVAAAGNDGWMQRVKYRAKNGFGGYNLSNQIFVIKQGQVVSVLGD